MSPQRILYVKKKTMDVTDAEGKKEFTTWRHSRRADEDSLGLRRIALGRASQGQAFQSNATRHLGYAVRARDMLVLDLDLRFEPTTNLLASLVRRGAHDHVVCNRVTLTAKSIPHSPWASTMSAPAPSISSLPDWAIRGSSSTWSPPATPTVGC